jgi:glutathione S-transferase
VEALAKIHVISSSARMTKPTLIIGNKNYSSWSLRPYMTLSMAGIPFDEKMIRFGEPRFTREVKRISKAGQVPILLHNGLMINDSLAIIEYAHETWPAKNVWPKNKAARAKARSVAAEMHAGFRGIRSSCPMNLRREKKLPPGGITQAIAKDVARIEQLWADCREDFGKGGPFLFGKFSAADAMFTPIASRLETFAIPVSKATRAYINAILATPAFVKWKAESASEKWIVAEDEVD